MQSLLVEVNRIHNLATKNAFVAHETCRRTWKELTLMCSEDDLQEDGFSERFKFDSTPPRRNVLRRTPSLEDSEFSSSAATVNARVIDDKDDATSPPLLLHASTLPRVRLHRLTTPTTLLLHLLLMGTSRCSMSSNLFGPYWQKGEKHMSLIVFKRVHMGGCFIIFAWCLQLSLLIHLVLWVVTLKHDGRLLLICYSVMRW